MHLLEWIAISSAAASLAGSLTQQLPGALRSGGFADLVVPVAMLGATSGIALGLLGAGPLWMAGGAILLSIGSSDVLTFRSFEALFATGTTPAASVQQTMLSAIASAAASAVFVIA
jgi:hypothetical protein